MPLSTVIKPTLIAYYGTSATDQPYRFGGKVDDLMLVATVTQNGSMDFPGGSTSKLMTYNAFGALATDAARGITSVTYDDFGNPLRTGFSGGGYTENTNSATGEKLKTILGVPVTSTGSSLTAMGRTVMTYRGNVVYRNGIVDMVLFPGGYATVSGSTVTFHYYTQDYLGNNRAVINGSTGAIEQTVAYYPYGAVIADLGTPTIGQPYKFGGKELITSNGLNEYDFGARQYYSAVPAFTRIDPLCESFTHLSPYLYCANNPVNLVDRNGLAPSEEEAARMADYVYGQEKVKLTGGWKESQRNIDNLVMTVDKSGFKSSLFERTVDGVTEYAYAYAGTDFTSADDWKNNFQQVFGQSEQYATAIGNAGILKENISEELTFVGYSLGGGLAAASAYATGGHAMTFNAAGVSSATIDTSSAATIDAFVTRNDELHKFQSITPGVSVANGNIHWRPGNSSLLGHSVKNFYQPSIASLIYNQFKDVCIRGMNQINTMFQPSNILGF